MQNVIIEDWPESSRNAIGSDDADRPPSLELARRLALAETRTQELIELEERGSGHVELVAHLERISYGAHAGRVLITSPPPLELGPCLIGFGGDALRALESMLDAMRGTPTERNEPDGLAELLLSRARCFAEIVRAPIRESADLDRVNGLMALREAFWILGRHAIHASSFVGLPSAVSD